MRAQRPHIRRPGVTLVEAAVVLPVFLTLILGTLDLALALFRYHLVADAVRHAARQATVHGALASRLGPWGPAPVGPLSATDPSPVAATLQPYLTGLDGGSTTIAVEWPDGSNEADRRVRVTVCTTYQPLTPFVGGGQPIPLSATSVMRIAH